MPGAAHDQDIGAVAADKLAADLDHADDGGFGIGQFGDG